MSLPKKKALLITLLWALAVIMILGVLNYLYPSKPELGQHTQVSIPLSPPLKPAPSSEAAGEEHNNYSFEEKPNSEALTLPSQSVRKIVPPQHRGKALIAIIIDDVGLDLHGTHQAIALPPVITLSFLPYATHLHDQTKEAAAAGHELMLHMPMEPMGHDDPGPNALFVNLSDDEKRQRFTQALESFQGFDGVNNHMGSKFTADSASMSTIMPLIKSRNLFFLDSRTSAQSVGESLARHEGIPTLARDVFLDDDIKSDAIKSQLRRAEEIAKKRGFVVAIGHPHTITLDVLDAWIKDAGVRGFTLVPVHDLLIESESDTPHFGPP